jgi:hypothetical protein
VSDILKTIVLAWEGQSAQHWSQVNPMARGALLARARRIATAEGRYLLGDDPHSNYVDGVLRLVWQTDADPVVSWWWE